MLGIRSGADRRDSCPRGLTLIAVGGRGRDTSSGQPFLEGESARRVWAPAPQHGQHPRPVPGQVDELYEGYCIQCRLRDGASNMQRAFSRCPPSRASRESLQELGRSLQECTEVGCRPAGVGFPGPWASSATGLCLPGPVHVPAPAPRPRLGAGAEPPCVTSAGHVAHRGGPGGAPGRVPHQDER